MTVGRRHRLSTLDRIASAQMCTWVRAGAVYLLILNIAQEEEVKALEFRA